MQPRRLKRDEGYAMPSPPALLCFRRFPRSTGRCGSSSSTSAPIPAGCGICSRSRWSPTRRALCRLHPGRAVLFGLRPLSGVRGAAAGDIPGPRWLLLLSRLPQQCEGPGFRTGTLGTPRKIAGVRLEQHHNILTGTTILEGLPGMIVRTDLGKPVGEAEMPPLFPSYRLKIIPRADGPGFALKQLVTVQPGASTTHLLYKGTGELWLHPAAGHGLSALQPIEMLDAFYMVASYIKSYGEIVYDYTAP